MGNDAGMTLTVQPGWPVALALGLLLLGPSLLGWLVGDIVATALNWRDALREARR